MQTVKLGSIGSAVKTLQKLLNEKIKAGLKTDGIFGKKTRDAVRVYQTANRLASDGIVGRMTWAKLQGQPTSVKTRPVDYKQYDSRWGKKLYTSTGNKSQTMASSACGPTAMADVVATFFDTNVTPYDLAQIAVKRGYRTVNSGTAWNFFDYMATQYDFSAYKRTTSHTALTDALSKGALVIASMAPGYWTKGGHFICVWDYDGTYIHACDPASATRKKQKFAAFKKERKCYFLFYPPVGWNNADDEPESPVVPKPTIAPPPPVIPPVLPPPYAGPTGIYDISKWQGSVNWSKVKASNKAGLMICRAGYGQNTKDVRFEEYIVGLKKYQIPYAAYWFSYATSAAGAEREAESFYKTASPHNPLFYVMDAEDRRVDGSYINAFARKLRAISGGAKIGLYVANHLFAEYQKEGMDLTLWDFFWIPKYVKDSPPTHRPCDLWQYGGSKVDGFGGSIDTNKIPASGRYGIEWYLGL